jgi:hypothetical protein
VAAQSGNCLPIVGTTTQSLMPAPYKTCPACPPKLLRRWECNRKVGLVRCHCEQVASQPTRQSKLLFQYSSFDIPCSIFDISSGHSERSPRSCFRKKARGRSRGIYYKSHCEQAPFSLSLVPAFTLVRAKESRGGDRDNLNFFFNILHSTFFIRDLP